MQWLHPLCIRRLYIKHKIAIYQRLLDFKATDPHHLKNCTPPAANRSL